LVDTQDLKSCGPWAVRVQVPLLVQKASVIHFAEAFLLFKLNI